MNFDVSTYKYTFLKLSIVLNVIAIILIVIFGLKLGIDFTGGAIFRYKIQNTELDISLVEKNILQKFAENNVGVSRVSVSNGFVTVQTGLVSSELSTAINNSVDSEQVSLDSFESVGSVIGSETIRKSLIALGLALLAVLLYIAFAFKDIPQPYSSFKFGASAIFAMVHDVLIVLGFFVILGKQAGVEIDLLFVTALLTIIGFSVHDTIVVFDRIRENLIKKGKGKNFEKIVALSVSETLRRSLATSFTVLIILICLFVFGGASIKYFILAFIIGIVAGTYSSIFIASPVLILWESKK